MSVTVSWPYTNGTTQKEATFKMARLSKDDYIEVMRVSDQNDKVLAQYRNLTSPTNTGEYVQLRAERRNNISKSYKTAYPALTKTGYMWSVKLEEALRVTDEQGIMTDNPISITLTCAAADGTYVDGGIDSGAAWLKALQRFFGLIFEGVFDISDDKITIDQENQSFIDVLMHSAAELRTNVTEQA